MSLVDNSDIAMEGEITTAWLEFQALQGRFYESDQRGLLSMGWMEWLVRTLFSPLLVNSVHRTCLSRSWKSIARMEKVPSDIVRRIDDLFCDSLIPTNPRSNYSDSIGRIFCKVHSDLQNQIDIQQHPTARSFTVFQNQQPLYQVANSGYGQLDFYTSDNQKLFNNDHDSLWDENGRRIGAIKLAVDYKFLNTAMEIADGKDRLLMKVDQNQSKELLVFREAITNQLLAVALLSKNGKKVDWRITVLVPHMDEKRDLIILGALKFSQHYHFDNPDCTLYVKGVPKTQTF